jgi:SAM-dependent methyltransferase
MHEDLVDSLACPACRAALRLDVRTRDPGTGRVVSGALECSAEGTRYPVRGGVPRLLPSTGRTVDRDPELRTADHFAQEFTALAEDDRDFADDDMLEYVFYSRTGLDPALYARVPGDPYMVELPDATNYRPDGSFLSGKTVLDAGCGAGRLTTVAARSARRVVGLDLGDHVDRAVARMWHSDHVDIVQGSVLEPPFGDGTFDYVFSVGVLHHTPDPGGGCRALARAVRCGGAMSIWVYPPSYWGRPIQAAVGRRIHAGLARMPPEAALCACKRWLYPLGRLQMRLAERRWSKLLGAPLFVVNVPRHPQPEIMLTTIFDYYCPPIISTHTYDEARDWLKDAGFTELRRVPVPTAWFAEQRPRAAISP